MPFWLLIVAGLALLFVGGQGLVQGAARLALRLGVPHLIVGLTVVAFGTSSPELFVAVRAAISGQGDIAVGNIVGSNIGNVGLILALCALVFPLHVAMQVLRVDMPVALGATVLMIVLVQDGTVGRVDGMLLLLALVAYLGGLLWLARREKDPAVAAEFAAALPPSSKPWYIDVGLVIGGLVALLLGARWLVDGAVQAARLIGLSEAVIGLTVVAIGTSLPELAACLIASFRRQGDIAVGNIVGSNIFNLLAVLGTASATAPLTAHGVSTIDLVVMLVFTAILLPLMKTGFVVRRWEGALLLTAYVGYLAHLFFTGSVPG